ncbi:hypothetical protein K435DRAFT_869450 [Dendrothele bispora CBS 962.96]|uniref:Uncharacterized protein n=1 Tax=Dendrothele bispora (strain CBS 962.96) TaxID=1314807 RepID=A0A4V4HCZ8_DENBC|nr:hypothetical protein K435DRAFT_869450 [Dendrothele bispora CBS 962.96]
MAPSIDRPTYDIVNFLHRRFRYFFTPGGGPPRIIPRAEFANFVDERRDPKSLPVIAIRLYHECVRTLLLSFSTNQVPVPDWCPGWLDLDKTSHVRYPQRIGCSSICVGEEVQVWLRGATEPQPLRFSAEEQLSSSRLHHNGKSRSQLQFLSTHLALYDQQRLACMELVHAPLAPEDDN